LVMSTVGLRPLQIASIEVPNNFKSSSRFIKMNGLN